MPAVYIHIPFCEHICYYCDFNKVFLEGQPVDEYIQSLLTEIRLTLEKHPTKVSETIYIGGGTPTSLTAKQLDVLLTGIHRYLPTLLKISCTSLLHKIITMNNSVAMAEA